MKKWKVIRNKGKTRFFLWQFLPGMIVFTFGSIAGIILHSVQLLMNGIIFGIIWLIVGFYSGNKTWEKYEKKYTNWISGEIEGKSNGKRIPAPLPNLRK